MSILTHISVLPKSIGKLSSLDSLDCSENMLSGRCPRTTSTTFELSAISVFVFADAEKQRVRAALPDCRLPF
jgi:hypothetical protein